METLTKLGESKFIRVKRIRSHSGHAEFLGYVQDAGWIARKACADIPSPYAYGPTKHAMLWNGLNVVLFETSHKVYDVFSIPSNVPIFSNEDEAEASNFA